MFKFLAAQLTMIFRSGVSRRNRQLLLRFLLLMFGMVTLYSISFHLLMLREGHEHSWLTGLYWTLTVMSTLGFGDITFHTDLGRMFSMAVLVSGLILVLARTTTR
jgi:hypothetical protein